MEFVVKEMTCGHYEAAVQRAVKRVAPKAEVVIDRGRGRVSGSGAADAKSVESAIRAESYEVATIE